jgi:hypothetical protein
MKLEVTRVFPTLIGQLRVPDSDRDESGIAGLIVRAEAGYSTREVEPKVSAEQKD